VGRLIALGGVHGQYTKLVNLLDELQLTKEDEIVFLGNYVGIGPQTADVIETLKGIKRHERASFLMGPHDAALLDYLRTGKAEKDWLVQSGNAIFESYNGDIPERHGQFLSDLRDQIFVETSLGVRKYLFTNVSVEQPPDGVLNVFLGQEVTEPTFYNDNRLCMNTGAEKEGYPLTGVVLPKTKWGQFEFIQERGDLIQDYVYDSRNYSDSRN